MNKKNCFLIVILIMSCIHIYDCLINGDVAPKLFNLLMAGAIAGGSIYLLVAKKEVPFSIVSKKGIFILLLSVCIISGGRHLFIFDSGENMIVQIKSTGEKNPESKANEIWISSIRLNNNTIGLDQINLDNTNWILNGNALFTKPESTEACIEIELKNVKKLEFSFYKNQYCGIVEIMYNNKCETIDLYSNESMVMQHTITTDSKKVTFTNIIFTICALGYIYGFIMVIFTLSHSEILRKICFVLVCEIILGLLISGDLKGLFENNTIIILIMLTAISEWYYILIISSSDMKIYFESRYKILIICCSMYTAFAITGHGLFLNDEKFEIHKIGSFFLATCLTYPVIFFFLFLLKKIKHNKYLYEFKELNVTKFGLLCFVVMFIPLLVLSLGYYPGNMTPDGVAQWTGALGFIDLLDNHPAIHTLFLRLCYAIYPSVYTAVIVHVILFCTLWSCFFTILYRKHIRVSLLLSIAFILSCCSNNYMSLFLISKNTSYALVIMWNMILLIKMTEDKSFWNAKWNIVQFIIALALLYTVRHNGFLGTYAMFAILILYGVYNKTCLAKTLFVVIMATILINAIRGPFYQAMGVKQIQQSHASMGPLRNPVGMFLISNEKIPEDVQYIVDKMGTQEQWIKYYNPYNGDKLGWSEMRYNFSNCSLREGFELYFALLKKNPGLVIKDRLTATDLLWNVTEPKAIYAKYGVYNGRFITGIWGARSDVTNIFPQSLVNDEYLSDECYFAPNKLTTLGSLGNKLATSSQLADIFFYRNGIYIIGMMILIIFNIGEKHNNRNLIMIPSFITLCSLLLAASWQIYQYYWFFSLSINMFFLYVCSSNGEHKN